MTLLIIQYRWQTTNPMDGTVLAFMQEKKIVATFGSNFTKGATYNQTVSIKKYIETQIVVYVLGIATN